MTIGRIESSARCCDLRVLIVHSLFLPTAFCFLLPAHRSLLTAYCPLLTAHCLLLTAYCDGAPAGIRTPNQQIMRRFEGHQQGETKRDNPVFTESAAVKVRYISLRLSTPSGHNRAI